MSTNAAVDFNALLGIKIEDAKPPVPMAVGGYTFIIKGHEFGTSDKKGTPYCRFLVRPVAPGPDVDMTLNPENWREKEMRIDFWLTPDAQYRLGEFLSACGMNTSGRTFSAVIPETTNATFFGNVTHSFKKDKPNDPPYANIDSYARAV